MCTIIIEQHTEKYGVEANTVSTHHRNECSLAVEYIYIYIESGGDIMVVCANETAKLVLRPPLTLSRKRKMRKTETTHRFGYCCCCCVYAMVACQLSISTRISYTQCIYKYAYTSIHAHLHSLHIHAHISHAHTKALLLDGWCYA